MPGQAAVARPPAACPREQVRETVALSAPFFHVTPAALQNKLSAILAFQVWASTLLLYARACPAAEL